MTKVTGLLPKIVIKSENQVDNQSVDPHRSSGLREAQSPPVADH